ncbi:hypothetical protein JR316_0010808 [Psilocybe cubensis]|uniref:Uncharacterized protein n=2 Tax=Psilocybe cubensis TaxID=181762 RepID=A0ACB8GNE3_PSICU|nr:hypothetical protein JR316_0010808 [Psilocybe cubensis]KAH9476892.1 hypothetical protein JR316_0010808 [Psilocybe cubensis]
MAVILPNPAAADENSEQHDTFESIAPERAYTSNSYDVEAEPDTVEDASTVDQGKCEPSDDVVEEPQRLSVSEPGPGNAIEEIEAALADHASIGNQGECEPSYDANEKPQRLPVSGSCPGNASRDIKPALAASESDVKLSAEVRRILHYFLASMPEFLLLSMVYMQIQLTLDQWSKGKAEITQVIIYAVYEVCVILALMILASPLTREWLIARPTVGVVYEGYAFYYARTRFSSSGRVKADLLIIMLTFVFALTTTCLCVKNLLIRTDSNEGKPSDEKNDVPESPPPDYGYNFTVWIPGNSKILLVPKLVILGNVA